MHELYLDHLGFHSNIKYIFIIGGEKQQQKTKKLIQGWPKRPSISGNEKTNVKKICKLSCSLV